MDANGWIYILDADIVNQNGFSPYNDFCNVYERTIFNKKIYTICAYTEYHDLELDYPIKTLYDYKGINAIIDMWEIWT